MRHLSKRWKRRNRRERPTIVYLFNKYAVIWVRVRKIHFTPTTYGFWLAYEVHDKDDGDVTWFIDMRIREEKYVNIL